MSIVTSNRSTISTPAPELSLPESLVIRGYGFSTGTADDSTPVLVRQSQSTRRKQPKAKVLRRLKGFVVAPGDDEYRVVFIENGDYVLYDLPAADLRKRGITAENQPFEMDEITVDMEPYTDLVGYEFRPLAKAGDSFLEALPIDDDRQRKLNLIRTKFGKAAG